MLKRLILCLIVALGFGKSAEACTLLDWNWYTSFYQPNLLEMTRQAQTIDWIEVSTAGPQRCPRIPDPSLEPAAAREAFIEQNETPSLVQPCTFHDEPAPGMHVATVVERLKGASPARYELFLPFAGMGRATTGFSDIRELPLTQAYVFVRDQHIEADRRHMSPAYWHRAVIDMPRDGMSSCGGWPALDPSLRYVVLRNRDGAVMSYAPVQHNDDLLLVRLRAFRRGADIRSTMRAEDYFRRTIALALVRIDECPRSVKRVERYDPDETPGRITALEGSLDNFSDQAQIWHYFQFRKQGCPAGRQFLLSAFQPGVAYDQWGERPLLDVALGILSLAVDPYLGAVFEPPFDQPPPAQPIQVDSKGRIAVSDIYTNLKLEGPAYVSLNDAIRWHQEGRSARTIKTLWPWPLRRLVFRGR